jgi:hypothetical protein
MVVPIAWRNKDDHALACSGQKDAICVAQVLSAFRRIDVAPAASAEVVITPATIDEPQIDIVCIEMAIRSERPRS